jgi:phosphoglycolate phosphatase
MTPDALVFDLDGTLWDAAAASTIGWNLALEEMGVALRVTVDDIRSVSGTPFDQCVETLLPELCPPSEATLRSLGAHERAVLEESGGTVYEGVAAGLQELAMHFPLFLVSNCPDWYLDAFLRITGLRVCFRDWDCHGSSGLPKARMLLGLAERYGLKQVVYVGDTQGDEDATFEAGMDFAFARYGFGKARAPLLSFDSFGELVGNFLGRIDHDG